MFRRHVPVAGRIWSAPSPVGVTVGQVRVAAMAAAHGKDTFLSAKYRRIASRRGPIKAIVAVEHAMLVAIWHMLTNGTFYQDPGGDYYTRLNPDKSKQRAVNQRRKMGYDVTLSPVETAVAR